MSIPRDVVEEGWPGRRKKEEVSGIASKKLGSRGDCARNLVKSHPHSGNYLCKRQEDRGENAGQKNARSLKLSGNRWTDLGGAQSKEDIR